MNYHNTKHISPSAYLLMLICMICAYTSKVRAQESCYEQYLREHNMPFLTAEDADDSYEDLKKEVLARQAMRKEALFLPLMLAADTISGTCHLLAPDGSLIADVHLALVDSTWYMWLSVDPLADKYPGNSPYLYCGGNPVMLVDPDGMEKINELPRLSKNMETLDILEILTLHQGVNEIIDNNHSIVIAAHGDETNMYFGRNGQLISQSPEALLRYI